MSYPNDLKYTADHEWIRVDGNVAYIGITDHAQSELGDIAYVDIVEDLAEINANESFGTIEAIKAVSDLIAPVTGKIIEINTTLNDDPSIVNTAPYNEGWMLKVEIANPAELEELMDAESYIKFIGK